MKRTEVNTGGMKAQPEDQDFEVKFQTTYWGPWMIYSQLTPEFLKELITISDKTRAEGLGEDGNILASKDYRDQLAGNIHEEYNLEDHLDWFGDKFRRWMDAFLMNVPRQEMLSQLLVKKAKEKGFKLKPNQDIQYGWALDSLWVNYQKKHEWNPPHTHDSDVSFVIWLDIPEEIHKEHKEHEWKSNHQGPGVIVFQYGHQEYFNVHNTWIMPNSGDVAIFPSHLQHFVHSFQSDVTRISLSGNIVIDVNIDDDPSEHSSPNLE